MIIVTTPNDSDRVLVDSSGWLEYAADDPCAAKFAPYIEGGAPILVPTIVLYEVYKKISQERGKGAADRFASQALRQVVVPLDETLTLASARASIEFNLPMADAIIYATAIAHDARLITSESHFQSLPGVVFIQPD